MKDKNIYEITEIIELYQLNEVFICDCIDREWIIPTNTEQRLLDQEDIARILLIKDLKEVFGVNDESIPIILHLIDQIHGLKSRLSHYMESIG
jgi:chaperone modulatory protein CbpM